MSHRRPLRHGELRDYSPFEDLPPPPPSYQAAPPPRRHKSEKHRGRLPPDWISPPGPSEAYIYEPPHERRSRQRRHSPPPRFHYPSQFEEPRRQRHSLSPPARHYREHRAISPEPRPAIRNRERHIQSPKPRNYTEYRGRAPRTQYTPSAPMHRESRPQHYNDDQDGRYRGSRPAGFSVSRSRGQGPRYPVEHSQDENSNVHSRHRARSQGQPKPSDASPAPTRGRGTATASGTKRRHASAPAAKRIAELLANPLVKAGARTALSAGAQAAMNSRSDPSPWLGAKGAKVATAALGAALVDGFMGQKHPGSMRQDIMRQGVAAVMGEAERRATRGTAHMKGRAANTGTGTSGRARHTHQHGHH